MKKRHPKGFTLIELLVGLVVGGLLMAALVALSGSVQKTFGYTKEINELQANLRFTMKILTDDLARVGYMTLPDPAHANEVCHIDRSMADCQPVGSMPAIELSADGVLTLRGNYTAARDYLFKPETGEILCRDGGEFSPSAQMDAACTLNYDPKMHPFADGPDELHDIFCLDLPVRIETGKGFCYNTINGVDNANAVISFQNPLNLDASQGAQRRVNPVNIVTYQVVEDPDYQPPYPNPENAAKRFVLVRTLQRCSDGVLINQPVEVGGFLLPLEGEIPGIQLQGYADQSPDLNLCTEPWQPLIQGPFEISPAAPLDPLRLRAISITMRARTEFEEPSFVMADYGDSFQSLEYGIDLDGNPQNGLAHVRVERTLVELRNLGLNLSM